MLCLDQLLLILQFCSSINVFEFHHYSNKQGCILFPKKTYMILIASRDVKLLICQCGMMWLRVQSRAKETITQFHILLCVLASLQSRHSYYSDKLIILFHHVHGLVFNASLPFFLSYLNLLYFVGVRLSLNHALKEIINGIYFGISITAAKGCYNIYREGISVQATIFSVMRPSPTMRNTPR